MISPMGKRASIVAEGDSTPRVGTTQEEYETRFDTTQTSPFVVNDGTMVDTVEQKSSISCQPSCWGYLQRGAVRINLDVREARDGKINAYILGRNGDGDVVVNDKRVSGKHCIIYCEYESIMAQMRVYVEDVRYQTLLYMTKKNTFFNVK